jgi:hypothetical protein
MAPKKKLKLVKALPNSGFAVGLRRRQHGDSGGGMLARLPVDQNQAPAPEPTPVPAQKRRRVAKNLPTAAPPPIQLDHPSLPSNRSILLIRLRSPSQDPLPYR